MAVKHTKSGTRLNMPIKPLTQPEIDRLNTAGRARLRTVEYIAEHRIRYGCGPTLHHLWAVYLFGHPDAAVREPRGGVRLLHRLRPLGVRWGETYGSIHLRRAHYEWLRPFIVDRLEREGRYRPRRPDRMKLERPR